MPDRTVPALAHGRPETVRTDTPAALGSAGGSRVSFGSRPFGLVRGRPAIVRVFERHGHWAARRISLAPAWPAECAAPLTGHGAPVLVRMYATVEIASAGAGAGEGGELVIVDTSALLAALFREEDAHGSIRQR